MNVRHPMSVYQNFYQKYFLWYNGLKAFLFWCDDIYYAKFSPDNENTSYLYILSVYFEYCTLFLKKLTRMTMRELRYSKLMRGEFSI